MREAPALTLIDELLAAGRDGRRARSGRDGRGDAPARRSRVEFAASSYEALDRRRRARRRDRLERVPPPGFRAHQAGAHAAHHRRRAEPLSARQDGGARVSRTPSIGRVGAARCHDRADDPRDRRRGSRRLARRRDCSRRMRRTASSRSTTTSTGRAENHVAGRGVSRRAHEGHRRARARDAGRRLPPRRVRAHRDQSFDDVATGLRLSTSSGRSRSPSSAGSAASASSCTRRRAPSSPSRATGGIRIRTRSPRRRTSISSTTTADGTTSPYAICYFYNAFGPRERRRPASTRRSSPDFERAYLAGQAARRSLRPGTQRRAFTYVQDLARGIILVGEQGHGDGYALGAATSRTASSRSPRRSAARSTMVDGYSGRARRRRTTRRKARDELGWEADGRRHGLHPGVRERRAAASAVRGRDPASTPARGLPVSFRTVRRLEPIATRPGYQPRYAPILLETRRGACRWLAVAACRPEFQLKNFTTNEALYAASLREYRAPALGQRGHRLREADDGSAGPRYAAAAVVLVSGVGARAHGRASARGAELQPPRRVVSRGFARRRRRARGGARRIAGCGGSRSSTRRTARRRSRRTTR